MATTDALLDAALSADSLTGDIGRLGSHLRGVHARAQLRDAWGEPAASDECHSVVESWAFQRDRFVAFVVAMDEIVAE
jgi:hypothetical protein